MEGFLELKSAHVRYIVDYIDTHGYSAQGFYYGLKKVGDAWQLRNGTTFYGYVKDKQLLGLASFSPAQVMTCHFDSKAIYTKLDFLRAIRTNAPVLIKAECADLIQIRKVLERVAICHEIDLCSVMSVSEETFVADDRVHGMIVDASLIPVRDAVGFLLEVEKGFGRNPLTVNQLKDKMDAIENYIYYIENSHIAAQAVIEFETQTFAQLGGVYTLKKYRGKGMGKRVTSVLTQRMLEKGLKVNLLVMNANEPAVSAYSRLGYEKVYELGLMAIDMI